MSMTLSITHNVSLTSSLPNAFGNQSASPFVLTGLDIHPSTPADTQVTITVTPAAGGTAETLTQGVDFYSNAEGKILIRDDKLSQGAIVLFSRATDKENFEDDFSDLGAAPSGSTKRRDLQLMYISQELDNRLTTIETGGLPGITMTSLFAANTLFGPGVINLQGGSGITLNSAGNGTIIDFAVDYPDLLANNLFVAGVEGVVNNYLVSNPTVFPVTSVASRTGDISLTHTDIAGLATVASTGAYADVTGTPTNVSTFTNDANYITNATASITESQVANLTTNLAAKVNLTALAGGTSGQVLKKSSNTDHDYAWGDDLGGSSGNQISFLSNVGDVTLTDLSAGEFIKRNATNDAFVNVSIATSDISDYPTFATVATSGSYADLSNKPTNVSTFTNDANYITNATAAIAQSQVTNLVSDLASKANTSSLAAVATSGAYADLTGTPNLATKLDASVLHGGTTGQILSKTNNNNNQFTYIDPPTPTVRLFQVKWGQGYGDGTSTNPNGEELGFPPDYFNASNQTGGTRTNINAPGTFSVGVGNVPTFTVNASGTYKVFVSTFMGINNTSRARFALEVRKNGVVMADRSCDFDSGGFNVASRQNLVIECYFTATSGNSITMNLRDTFGSGVSSSNGILIIQKVD